LAPDKTIPNSAIMYYHIPTLEKEWPLGPLESCVVVTLADWVLLVLGTSLGAIWALMTRASASKVALPPGLKLKVRSRIS